MWLTLHGPTRPLTHINPTNSATMPPRRARSAVVTGFGSVHNTIGSMYHAM